MTDSIDTIAAQVEAARNLDTPPLHLWDPPLSGDIDIEIDREGHWYHEGGRIERLSLVRLFASILRREADGHYYLVTPVEKWRIRVPFYPLLVVDVIERRDNNGEVCLDAVLNTGRIVPIEDANALFLDAAADNVAALRLPHGLTALFSRAAWYRLVESAEQDGDVLSVRSGGQRIFLSPG